MAATPSTKCLVLKSFSLTPSCSKEGVWCITRHYKVADQVVSVAHLHKGFCRGHMTKGVIWLETTTLISTFGLYINNLLTFISKYYFMSLIFIFHYCEKEQLGFCCHFDWARSALFPVSRICAELLLNILIYV